MSTPSPFDHLPAAFTMFADYIQEGRSKWCTSDIVVFESGVVALFDKALKERLAPFTKGNPLITGSSVEAATRLVEVAKATTGIWLGEEKKQEVCLNLNLKNEQDEYLFMCLFGSCMVALTVKKTKKEIEEIESEVIQRAESIIAQELKKSALPVSGVYISGGGWWITQRDGSLVRAIVRSSPPE